MLNAADVLTPLKYIDSVLDWKLTVKEVSEQKFHDESFVTDLLFLGFIWMAWLKLQTTHSC